MKYKNKTNTQNKHTPLANIGSSHLKVLVSIIRVTMGSIEASVDVHYAGDDDANLYKQILYKIYCSY